MIRWRRCSNFVLHHQHRDQDQRCLESLDEVKTRSSIETRSESDLVLIVFGTSPFIMQVC